MLTCNHSPVHAKDGRIGSATEPVRSETCNFIASIMLCTDFIPDPITAEEAAYDMENWNDDGVDLPIGMTPELFAEVWNEMI